VASVAAEQPGHRYIRISGAPCRQALSSLLALLVLGKV
jgi:hypothetical protein